MTFVYKGGKYRIKERIGRTDLAENWNYKAKYQYVTITRKPKGKKVFKRYRNLPKKFI